MRRGTRLAIGAVALIAGAGIFWTSTSLWTRDRLHTPGALAEACLRERDVPRVREHAARYLAYVATRKGRGGPPHIADHAAEILVEYFGFLFVPQAEQQQMIGDVRICSGPPVS